MHMTYFKSGIPAALFNRFIITGFFFVCVVTAFEGAVFRGYIPSPLSSPALVVKNVIFFMVIFLLLVRYVRSVFPPAGNPGFGRMAAAYAAHVTKTAVIIGIPLKIVIWTYLKLASDDFGIDPVSAFNSNGWLSFSYNAVILSLMIIGFAIISNTNSSGGSLMKALRFVFTRKGSVGISILAAFFIAIAVFDHLSRLIEYRTVVSLIVDSVIYPIRYYLFFLVVYAVSNIVAEGKDTGITG